MDIDFDDLISTDTANTAKGGLKFQPKGRPKLKPKPNPQPEPKPTPSTQFVEAAEGQTGINVNQIIENVIDSLESSSTKSQEENAESLDSPNGFLPEFTTVTLPSRPSEIATDDVGPAELELMNNVDASSNLDSIAQVENSLFWEPVDILAQSIACSGPKASKFKPKPKPKAQAHKLANNPDQEIVNDLVPTETISDYHLTEEESISLTEMDSAGRSSSERLTRLASVALDIINEGEIDYNNNDFDFVPENDSLVESKSKSKKLVKQRKKVQNERTEAPKKKFSHSTKRNKRPVNPELLKIPEDEFEFHMNTFPIKDLIRLREHKERIEEARTDATDEDATYYNYRTHMKITPRVKWTKQDTLLFYEAIQQLGTDLSMIKECFPGRTRNQIKSKFKKEYKQNRFRIESALNTRAKGNSQFNIVIERLKQAQAEDDDSENDDPYANIPVEDEVPLAADVNEGGLEKEVKDMEPDENLTAFDDIEDDDNPWSQYKSEI